MRGSGGEAPRKIFVDTLFTLAKNTSTDHMLACAALELLQHLFKLATPVKFLNMVFFGFAYPISIFTNTKSETFIIL